jgi:hypothetical protein
MVYFLSKDLHNYTSNNLVQNSQSHRHYKKSWNEAYNIQIRFHLECHIISVCESDITLPNMLLCLTR